MSSYSHMLMRTETVIIFLTASHYFYYEARRSVMASNTILLVDDEIIRNTLSELLANKSIRLTAAASVVAALRLIKLEILRCAPKRSTYTRSGYGLTVVTAMRHSHPKAGTVLLSSFTEIEATALAILGQADAI